MIEIIGVYIIGVLFFIAITVLVFNPFRAKVKEDKNA